MAALPATIKLFIVQSLACFDTISRTAKAVREEYGVEVSPQQCERYELRLQRRHGRVLRQHDGEALQRRRLEGRVPRDE
ncbi:hypothetical protein WS62_27790 [Burkholderia sp. ABCPW 14]|nr:hypothetical protein WS62_27790 [Burkholderia sp. ABCPW 14]